MDRHSSDGLGGLKPYRHLIDEQYLVVARADPCHRLPDMCVGGYIEQVRLVCTVQVNHIVSAVLTVVRTRDPVRTSLG